MSDALVIFQNENAHPLGGWLKEGFRHVWCAVLDERAHSWVGHDIRIGGYVSTVLSAADFPLAQAYRDRGMTVVPIQRVQQSVIGPFILNNCVGLTKAICGIRSTAVTPWQLYRHLLQEQGDPACLASSTT